MDEWILLYSFFSRTKGIDFKNSGAFFTTLVPQFQFSNGKILLLRNAWQHDDATPAAAAAGVSRPAASYRSNQTGKKHREIFRCNNALFKTHHPALRHKGREIEY